MDHISMALPFEDECAVTGADIESTIARLLAAGDVRALQVRSGKGDLVLTLSLDARGIEPRWACVFPYLGRLAEVTIRTARTARAMPAHAAPALEDVD